MNFIENKKKLFLNLVTGYIFFTILSHILFLTSPVVTVIIGTPLYSFQKYLAVIGVVLIIVDFLFYRNLFKNKYVVLLYSLIFIATISSLITIRYDLKHNLFDIVWFTIIIAIFYNYANMIKLEEFKKRLICLYKVVAFIWCLFCLLSFTAFLYDVGYYSRINPHSIHDYIRQGFLENRLFGIFMEMYTSSMISSLLLIISVFFYVFKKRKYFLFYAVIFFVHLILTGTRSSLLSLILISGLVIFYYLWRKKITTGNIFKRLFLSFSGGILSLCLVYGLATGSKYVLKQIPTLCIFSDNQDAYYSLVQKIPKVKKEEIQTNKDKKDILEREDTSTENISNNRLQIWKDYISLYKDIGLVGLSPNNYRKYIHENYKNLYIVEYVKNVMPNRYEKGDVYEPHNTYIYLYAATGVFGVLIFISFLSFCLRDVVKYLKNKNIDKSFYLAMTIIIFYLSNMMFDTIVIFDNDAITCIFWLLAGFVVKIARSSSNNKSCTK